MCTEVGMGKKVGERVQVISDAPTLQCETVSTPYSLSLVGVLAVQQRAAVRWRHRRVVEFPVEVVAVAWGCYRCLLHQFLVRFRFCFVQSTTWLESVRGWPLMAGIGSCLGVQFLGSAQVPVAKACSTRARWPAPCSSLARGARLRRCGRAVGLGALRCS